MQQQQQECGLVTVVAACVVGCENVYIAEAHVALVMPSMSGAMLWQRSVWGCVYALACSILSGRHRSTAAQCDDPADIQAEPWSDDL